MSCSLDTLGVRNANLETKVIFTTLLVVRSSLNVQQYGQQNLNKKYSDLVRDHFPVFSKEPKSPGKKKATKDMKTIDNNSLEISPRKIE